MRPTSQPLRLTLVAPEGRMGKAIAEAVADDPGFVLDPDHGDVIVDFSAPEALANSLERATLAAIPILIGTTGLDDLASRRILEASRSVAVLRASNTSLGVALLEELVERAAQVLGTGWDVEVLEIHHRRKRDAPSGTALTLGEAAARGRGTPMRREDARSGRQLEREDGAIGFAALRGGTVVGDHDVIFAGTDERVILSHRADSRMIFARGALAAARFLAGQAPGLYTMRDVVGAL
ncbi:4-hydroxy-tetrahydrodipicolinate reductase [Sphingomonas kaistensis]|uniref:4-hydroxy-tetrahydrodipicolinate reductase n=1 Tax=Sphingomonas kaistensis TaxID=298708 RepID=A0A7X6BHG0_9SPHN|nr:4-hydroxy-tetrahydrodipicolinate reductase [Sphingomonas kaistensis]NJC06923.1 4-hydroxy-tetrahydrodipicolinate reductase [Sphingomonas kaistensis]